MDREELIKTRENLIKTIVEYREIKWLVHFTHIDNLQSILDKGILPRSRLEQDGCDFIFVDGNRWDKKRDRCCLSIMFPNSAMLSSKKEYYSDEQWVFLLLKPDILWEKQCLFYPMNASKPMTRSSYIRSKGGEAFFSTPEAFDRMFGTLLFGEHFEKREEYLKHCVPTDVQAEVMVEGVIEPSYILKCILHRKQKADWNLTFILDYPNIKFEYGGVFSKLMKPRDKVNWSEIKLIQATAPV